MKTAFKVIHIIMLVLGIIILLIGLGLVILSINMTTSSIDDTGPGFIKLFGVIFAMVGITGIVIGILGIKKQYLACAIISGIASLSPIISISFFVTSGDSLNIKTILSLFISMAPSVLYMIMAIHLHIQKIENNKVNVI